MTLGPNEDERIIELASLDASQSEQIGICIIDEELKTTSGDGLDTWVRCVLSFSHNETFFGPAFGLRTGIENGSVGGLLASST